MSLVQIELQRAGFRQGPASLGGVAQPVEQRTFDQGIFEQKAQQFPQQIFSAWRHLRRTCAASILASWRRQRLGEAYCQQVVVLRKLKVVSVRHVGHFSSPRVTCRHESVSFGNGLEVHLAERHA
jgi:hypothetical protein